MTLVPRIIELLCEQNIHAVLLTVGRTIQAHDIPARRDLGVSAVFTPGASTRQVVEYIRGAIRS